MQPMNKELSLNRSVKPFKALSASLKTFQQMQSKQRLQASRLANYQKN